MKPLSMLLVSLLLTPTAARAAGAETLPEKAAPILKNADRIELYSLEPEPTAEQDKKPGKQTFHKWLVLGKAVLKEAKTRKQILDALDKGVGNGRRAKCFDPRHAIRATRGEKRVDLVICFACGHVYVYFGDKEEEAARLSIDDKTQTAFDKVLNAAKVPLAKQKKE